MVLAEDLKVGDAIIVKKGARVLGTVTAGKETEKQREAQALAIRVEFLKSSTSKTKLRGEQGAEQSATRMR